MKLLCHCIDERNKFNVYEDEDNEYEDMYGIAVILKWESLIQKGV